MQRRILPVSFFFSLLVLTSFGQNQTSDSSKTENTTVERNKNLIYGQILGDNILFGVNYERYYITRRVFNSSVRACFAFIGDHYALICGNNLALGKKNLLLEIGINPCLYVDEKNSYFYLSGNIGFRYQNQEKSDTFWRLAFNPLLYKPSGTIIIPVALGVGTSF